MFASTGLIIPPCGVPDVGFKSFHHPGCFLTQAFTKRHYCIFRPAMGPIAEAKWQKIFFINPTENFSCATLEYLIGYGGGRLPGAVSFADCEGFAVPSPCDELSTSRSTMNCFNSLCVISHLSFLLFDLPMLSHRNTKGLPSSQHFSSNMPCPMTPTDDLSLTVTAHFCWLLLR
jgi:hypothetical protein